MVTHLIFCISRLGAGSLCRWSKETFNLTTWCVCDQRSNLLQIWKGGGFMIQDPIYCRFDNMVCLWSKIQYTVDLIWWRFKQNFLKTDGHTSSTPAVSSSGARCWIGLHLQRHAENLQRSSETGAMVRFLWRLSLSVLYLVDATCRIRGFFILELDVTKTFLPPTVFPSGDNWVSVCLR